MLCFRKILVAKKYWKSRQGGYQDFLSNIFCVTVPKNFVGYPFCVSKKGLYRKISCIEGGHHGFAENFLSHRTENFVVGLVCFTKHPVSKKFMDRRDGVSPFPVKSFLSHSAEKFRRGYFL